MPPIENLFMSLPLITNYDDRTDIPTLPLIIKIIDIFDINNDIDIINYLFKDIEYYDPIMKIIIIADLI